MHSSCLLPLPLEKDEQNEMPRFIYSKTGRFLNPFVKKCNAFNFICEVKTQVQHHILLINLYSL